MHGGEPGSGPCPRLGRCAPICAPNWASTPARAATLRPECGFGFLSLYERGRWNARPADGAVISAFPFGEDVPGAAPSLFPFGEYVPGAVIGLLGGGELSCCGDSLSGDVACPAAGIEDNRASDPTANAKRVVEYNIGIFISSCWVAECGSQVFSGSMACRRIEHVGCKKSDANLFQLAAALPGARCRVF